MWTLKKKPPSPAHVWAADSVWLFFYNFLPAQAAITNFRLAYMRKSHFWLGKNLLLLKKNPAPSWQVTTAL